jgi:heme exporter protein CcmD
MLVKLFYMGGYAAYVWSAYAAVIFILLFNAWKTMRKLRGALKQINQSIDENHDAEATATDNYSY